MAMLKEWRRKGSRKMLCSSTTDLCRKCRSSCKWKIY